MAEGNVEVVAGFYAAVNRREIDTAMMAFAPSAEWHQRGAVPDRSVFRGADEIRTFLLSLVDQFDIRTEIGSYVDAYDHVTAFGTVGGRGSAGLDLDFTLVHVWRLDDGRCVRLYDFTGSGRSAR
jgi:ketosteroid isomerase-like protein